MKLLGYLYTPLPLSVHTQRIERFFSTHFREKPSQQCIGGSCYDSAEELAAAAAQLVCCNPCELRYSDAIIEISWSYANNWSGGVAHSTMAMYWTASQTDVIAGPSLWWNTCETVQAAFGALDTKDSIELGPVSSEWLDGDLGYGYLDRLRWCNYFGSTVWEQINTPIHENLFSTCHIELLASGAALLTTAESPNGSVNLKALRKLGKATRAFRAYYPKAQIAIPRVQLPEEVLQKVETEDAG